MCNNNILCFVDDFVFVQRNGKPRLIDIKNSTHIECLRYCFGPLIKRDLLLTKKKWNQHTILLLRKQNRPNTLKGIPNVLYQFPERYQAKDCRNTVNIDHLEFLKKEYLLNLKQFL